MRVVDAIAQWFEVAGFKHYFGYAGGAVWPFLDALTEKPEIEGIQAKHKFLHAVHMADLYHRVSGRVAPVIVSKGPGLLNAVGACASAMHKSSPVIIIAGGGTTHFLGKGGMQEIFYHGFEDATSIFRPVCKGVWMMVRPDTVIDILNQALKVATSGRPGPVFIEIPFDIQLAEVEGVIKSPTARAPQVVRPRVDADSIGRIVRMIGGKRCCSPAAASRVAARMRNCLPLPKSCRSRWSRRCRQRDSFRKTIRCRSARSAVPATNRPRVRAAKPI